MKDINQLELFTAVEAAYYENEGRLTQQELYASVAKQLKIDPQKHYEQVGKQDKVNVFYRAVRWVQVSLRERKLLKRVSRGVWELCGEGKQKLRAIKGAKSVLAMSTELGVMIWSKTESIFDKEIISEPIDLVLSSPPYVLQKSRAYGGQSDARLWVDFIMGVMDRIIPRLKDGASIVLNIGQDSFHPKLPARQTHLERLTLAMEDSGLWLIDRLVWTSSKPPGPTAYTSVKRVMLQTSYEYCLWFSNNPLKLQSNNQRVLTEHSPQYKAFVKKGGTQRAAVNSGGAHRKYVGDYSNVDLNKGKIPTNNMYFGNRCVRNESVNRFAREKGLPLHPAKMPFRLADFLVRFLVPAGGLILDPFGGSGCIASAAEHNGRRWISIEMMLDYILQSFVRFESIEGDTWFNPDLMKMVA